MGIENEMETCHFIAHAAEIDVEIQNYIIKLWGVFKPLHQQMEKGQDLGLLTVNRGYQHCYWNERTCKSCALWPIFHMHTYKITSSGKRKETTLESHSTSNIYFASARWQSPCTYARKPSSLQCTF